MSELKRRASLALRQLNLMLYWHQLLLCNAGLQPANVMPCFLGPAAEVERMVQSKAGANEVFNVKTSINDVMSHLLKVR